MYNGLNLNINKITPSNILGNLSVILIIVGFYFYLIAEIVFDSFSFRPAFLFLAYIFFLLNIFITGKIKIDHQLFFYLSTSLIIYAISSPFWLIPYDINVYLSAITAIVIINNYEFFLKAIKAFIFCTLILAFYEFLTKEYLFVVERQTYLGFRRLDEIFFGGLSGIFRAKVYFEGPLALSQFAIGAALLFRNNLKLLYTILLISIFANGRLGIVVCVGVIALYYFKRYDIGSFIFKPKTFFIILTSFISVIVLFFSVLDKASIERLTEVFNTSNQGNSDRIQFWINGFKMLMHTDLTHLIFGNNGKFESLYNNNAENGWLTLLLNNGILGFAYYFIPVILIIIVSLKKTPMDVIYIFLFIFCMFVQTFHLGASANLFYWLIIFSFLKPHK